MEFYTHLEVCEILGELNGYLYTVKCLCDVICINLHRWNYTVYTYVLKTGSTYWHWGSWQNDVFLPTVHPLTPTHGKSATSANMALYLLTLFIATPLFTTRQSPRALVLLKCLIRTNCQAFRLSQAVLFMCHPRQRRQKLIVFICGYWKSDFRC